MKHTKQSSALFLCLAFAGTVPAQAAEEGWYVVAFGGQSSTSGLSVAQADENLFDLLESVGLEITDFDSRLDDSDTGLGLAGGYQFNDHFAVEFAYVDIGSVDYRATGTVTDGTDTAAADVRLKSSADGPVLSGLGILPIGERFSVFGRVGISLLGADGSARAQFDGVGNRASQSSQKSDLVYGVGAEYALGKYSAIRLSWDRYLDVGTPDVTGDIDADLITLGFRLGTGWFR